jgi:hypothetical protein
MRHTGRVRLLTGPALVPPAGFALTCLAALWLSATSGSRAPARIHARATAYAEALSEGRLADAAAFHEGPDADVLDVERGRARILRGALWQIQWVRELSDGRYAARVIWFRGQEQGAEEELWVRGPDGVWRLGGWREGGRQGRSPRVPSARGRRPTFQ